MCAVVVPGFASGRQKGENRLRVRAGVFFDTVESFRASMRSSMTSRSGSWLVACIFWPLMDVKWVRYSSTVRMSLLMNVHGLVMREF